MMTAVILAGGKGVRMGDICRSLPKPLLCVNGKPILQRQIEALSKEGICDYLLVVGYLHERIVDYFGDGQRFGVTIRYFIEPQPMGTGGALKQIPFDNDFLFLNGDLLFDISLSHLLDFHFSKAAGITVYAHPNSHPGDSMLLQCDPDTDRVIACGRNSEQSDAFPNLCNAGIQVVSPRALNKIEKKDVLSFDGDILAPNITSGSVYAYRNSEFVLDVGTPTRFDFAQKALKSGIPEKKRRDALHRAVFLDRDGTINAYKGFLTERNQIELLPGAAKAIQMLRALGYLVFVVTNQPVIARGDCSPEELQRIHNRLEMLLADSGAYVDEIFFCPHHPDGGFPRENKQYKVPCNCRKPAPGLILKAKEKYQIDLARSYMVGDSRVDIETAQNAGCIPVHLRCGVQDAFRYDGLSFDDLLSFATYLLQSGEEHEHVECNC